MSHEPKSEDLTTRLLADFHALIASGEIKPGARLPPERELAKRFGASRSSLRPVIKMLGNAGVLSQRVGDGTYLNNDATGILSVPLKFLILLDGISLIELFEARLMLEPELAARAAQSASGEDLEAMRRTFAVFKETPVEADIHFHMAICRATRNRICMRMFEAIHKAFAQGMVWTAPASARTCFGVSSLHLHGHSSSKPRRVQKTDGRTPDACQGTSAAGAFGQARVLNSQTCRWDHQPRNGQPLKFNWLPIGR